MVKYMDTKWFITGIKWLRHKLTHRYKDQRQSMVSQIALGQHIFAFQALQEKSPNRQIALK